MNEPSPNNVNVDALIPAFSILQKTRKLSNVALYIPVPILAAIFSGFFWYMPTWYSDPFIVCILLLFSFGQISAFRQIMRLKKESSGSFGSIAILKNNSEGMDLETVKQQFIGKNLSGYTRDIILRWINLGLKGICEQNLELLENASNRRELADQKSMNFHITINRITLKLGFLGTLIGLIMTFGPMQQAILSLREFNGEMAFVTDIVKAVDGDRYAIFSTLIATGLSLIMEILTIQILTRLYSGFVIVDSCLKDWNLIVLQPAVKKHSQTKTTPQSLTEQQSELDKKILTVQASMENNLQSFVSTAEITEQQMNNLSGMHKKFGQHLQELFEFEKERQMEQLQNMESRISLTIKDTAHRNKQDIAEIESGDLDKRMKNLSEMHNKFNQSIQDMHQFEKSQYMDHLKEMETQIKDRMKEVKQYGKEYQKFKKSIDV